MLCSFNIQKLQFFNLIRKQKAYANEAKFNDVSKDQPIT